MFTKICKTVMWIGIVACFALSIVIGMQFRGIEFWVMLGGWTATLVIFSFFGMIVEIAENIKKSREIIEKMSRNDIQAKGIISPTPAGEVSYAKASHLASSEASDYWKCSWCGYTNLSTNKCCEKCKAPKS